LGRWSVKVEKRSETNRLGLNVKFGGGAGVGFRVLGSELGACDAGFRDQESGVCGLKRGGERVQG